MLTDAVIACAVFGQRFLDVEIRQITTDWEFVVLACDGIWDVMTNQVRLPTCPHFPAHHDQPGETADLPSLPRPS